MDTGYWSLNVKFGVQLCCWSDEDDKDMAVCSVMSLGRRLSVAGSQQRGGRVGRRYAGRARPDRHGSQNAVRRVREHVHRLRSCAPACPIIVMTAFGDAKTKEEALKAARLPIS